MVVAVPPVFCLLLQTCCTAPPRRPDHLHHQALPPGTRQDSQNGPVVRDIGLERTASRGNTLIDTVLEAWPGGGTAQSLLPCLCISFSTQMTCAEPIRVSRSGSSVSRLVSGKRAWIMPSQTPRVLAVALPSCYGSWYTKNPISTVSSCTLPYCTMGS